MLFDRVFSGVSARLQAMLPPIMSRRFVLGLSGGADSTALLHLLARMQQTHGIYVFAAHVNHGLRGENADADERFCVQLCEELGIKLFVRRLDGFTKGPGLEARAREARYAFLKEICRQVSADALLTAHHAMDQAETLFMHLMRGCGVAGLGAIREVSVQDGITIIRPLLDVTRPQILALLLPHREDESNLTQDNLRNTLRHTVLPALEALAPGACERMAQTALIAQQEDAFMDRLAHQHLTGRPYLALDALTPLHPALLRRVLRAFTGEQADAQTVFALEALISAPVGARVNLPGGTVAEKGYRYVSLPHLLCPIPPDVLCTAGAAETGDGKAAQVLPKKLYEASQWRHLKPQDFIRPFGMAGRKSMQDYFVDMKVDRAFRANIPLLALDGEIIWVPGLGASESARGRPGDEKVFLSARHEMPWLKQA